MTLIKQEKPSKPSHEEKVKAMSWCIKNNITIYFKPITWREGNIVINRNGSIEVSEEIYNQIKLKPKDAKYWDIVYNLYYKTFKEENNEKK